MIVKLFDSTVISTTGPKPPARPCTANGYHNVTSLKLKGSTEFCDESSTRFNEVSLRCEAPESLQFLQHCDTEGKSGNFIYSKTQLIQKWLLNCK